MMSMSLEEVSSMENSYSGGLNLKATELRLGLPGSESPERDNGNSELSSRSSFVSGGKRDFSVAIIHGGSGSGSGKNWVFSNGAGSGKSIDGFGSRSDPVEKDGFPHSTKPVLLEKKKNQIAGANGHGVSAPASKAQVVGWPPIRSFRRNSMASNAPKNEDDDVEAKLGSGCLYIKVSMDGAPYLRKVDLKTYGSYNDLSSALGKIFGCFIMGQRGSDGVPSRDGLSEGRAVDLVHGSEYAITYEDKDGDWMLVGDVPWKMFTDTCRRLRIMKSSEATGLAPRAMEKKCKDSSN